MLCSAQEDGPMMRRISTLLGLVAALSACSSGGTGDLKVSSVEPPVGTVNGSENVTLLGSGFQPGKTSCTVRFGVKEAANVTIVSESKIQVTTPAADPGPVDIMVTFDDGRTFKLGGAFTYKVPDQTKARDIFLSGGKVNVPGPAPQKK
jgi:IPT/TIG domain-containing protein